MSRNKRTGDNINHEAHLIGALYGFSILAIFNPSLLAHFVNQIFG